MITKKFIEELLAKGVDGYVSGGYKVEDWDPFGFKLSSNGWVGENIPARMILADAILQYLEENDK